MTTATEFTTPEDVESAAAYARRVHERAVTAIGELAGIAEAMSITPEHLEQRLSEQDLALDLYLRLGRA